MNLFLTTEGTLFVPGDRVLDQLVNWILHHEVKFAARLAALKALRYVLHILNGTHILLLPAIRDLMRLAVFYAKQLMRLAGFAIMWIVGCCSFCRVFDIVVPLQFQCVMLPLIAI